MTFEVVAGHGSEPATQQSGQCHGPGVIDAFFDSWLPDWYCGCYDIDILLLRLGLACDAVLAQLPLNKHGAESEQLWRFEGLLSKKLIEKNE